MHTNPGFESRRDSTGACRGPAVFACRDARHAARHAAIPRGISGSEACLMPHGILVKKMESAGIPMFSSSSSSNFSAAASV